MIKSLALILTTFAISPIVMAIELDALGSLGEDLYTKNINCSGNIVSFTRKKNQPPLLLINGKKVSINSSCYSSMDCTNFRGNESLLLVESPACGGNAVPESYLVYHLSTLGKTTLNYSSAKKYKLINY